MFDDLKNKEEGNNKSSQGLPMNNPNNSNKPAPKTPAIAQAPAQAKVEDIFSGSDNAPSQADTDVSISGNFGKEKPSALQAVAPSAITQNDDIKFEDSSSGPNKFIILLILLLVFAILSYVGYRAYTYYFQDMDTDIDVGVQDVDLDLNQDPADLNQDIDVDINDMENPIDLVDVQNDNQDSVDQMKTDRLDTDGDGLLDTEEIELGTDINNIDTDGDGLFDREEVQVYDTDPNNPDSDGDGFFDGKEVDGGYDPKGPGKLYDTDTFIE